MLSSSRYFLTALEAILSIMSNTGFKPLFVRCVIFYLKVAIVEVSVKSFTGVTRIEFDDQSYITKTYAFPYIDPIGDFPVKSTYMVPPLVV